MYVELLVGGGDQLSICASAQVCTVMTGDVTTVKAVWSLDLF